MKKLLFSLLFIAQSSVFAKDLLFEGYSKVTSQGLPMGYVITKYEYDQKTKQFFSSYYLKTNSQISETLKAVADQNFNPISYEYTSIVGNDTKTIDAKFKKGTMTAIINANGKKTKVENKVKPGVFLSTFLYYVMLKSPSGLKTDSKYNFEAIAEEDAQITSGSATVLKMEKFKGHDVFRVNNVFKKLEYTSYLTETGEILGTESKTQGISTEVVALPIEATQGFSFSQQTIQTLFGNIPAGLKNTISEKTQFVKSTTGDKQSEVPPGNGIHLKSESTELPPEAKKVSPGK